MVRPHLESPTRAATGTVLIVVPQRPLARTDSAARTGKIHRVSTGPQQKIVPVAAIPCVGTPAEYKWERSINAEGATLNNAVALVADTGV